MEKWSVDSCSHGRTTQNEYAGRKDFFLEEKHRFRRSTEKLKKEVEKACLHQHWHSEPSKRRELFNELRIKYRFGFASILCVITPK